MSTALASSPVDKKKSDQPKDQAKRYGTLIRVSDRFADALRRITQIEGVSMADYIDAQYLASTEQAYEAAVVAEAKRIERKRLDGKS